MDSPGPAAEDTGPFQKVERYCSSARLYESEALKTETRFTSWVCEGLGLGLGRVGFGFGKGWVWVGMGLGRRGWNGRGLGKERVWKGTAFSRAVSQPPSIRASAPEGRLRKHRRITSATYCAPRSYHVHYILNVHICAWKCSCRNTMKKP